MIIAPYEADTTLTQLFKEGKISHVYSNDGGFANFGVPLIQNITANGYYILDFTTDHNVNEVGPLML